MKSVVVTDGYQKNYRYTLSAPMGRQFDPRFQPDLTPKEMLELGVFGGVYMADRPKEFPGNWFTRAKLNLTLNHVPDKKLNYFGVLASQPLAEWQRKGWIYKDDPRGWFQWYCRYYMGRRIPEEDERQIKRWVAMRRHIAQIKHKCTPGDFSCNTRQRQALLHWAYDSRRM